MKEKNRKRERERERGGSVRVFRTRSVGCPALFQCV